MCTKKLLTYSAGSSAYILIATPLQGQIIYRDVDPDLLVDSVDTYLDLNLDGADDFKFIFNVQDAPGYAGDEWRIRVNPQDSNRVGYMVQNIPVTYLGSPYSTYSGGATYIAQDIIPMLPAGAVIDGAMAFHDQLANFYEKLYYYVNSSSNYVPFVFGEWMPSSEQFAAVQLVLDGETYNAWIRLSIDTNGIHIHDYAYQSVADAAIIAEPAGYDPHWMSVADAGTDGNAQDIHATFSAATNETGITAYHVVVVKGAADFAVEDLDALAADQQWVVVPDGSAEYATAFAADMRDTDGDPIVNGQHYTLYIVLEMDDASGYANIRTTASDPVYLLDAVNNVFSLSGLDVDNTGTGADVKIKFNEPPNTQGIAEYRIIAVKYDLADSFTLDDALTLTSDRYTAVGTGGGNYQILLGADAKDSDGDLLEAGRYKFFVWSVADGISADIHALEGPSGIFILETATAVVSDIVLEDVDEYGDGRDMRITFTAPPVGQTVESYRVFIVNFIDAFDFDTEIALGVPESNYIHYPTLEDGETITIDGAVSLVDIQGAPVAWGVPYYIYILSMHSALGLEDTLSAPSDQLIINYPAEPESVSTAFAQQITAHYQSGMLDLLSSVAVPNETRCVLYDMHGRKYCETEWSGAELHIPVALPAGIYFVAVQQGKYRQIIRFLAD